MSENKIKVSASTTSKAVRVNVSTPTLQGTVALSQDTSAYNANIAEQWAISENIVLGKDYSSKYYANKAKESASNAQGFESAIRDVYNGFLGETTEAIENVQGARNEAIANIETSKVEAIDSINSTKTTILNDIEFVAEGEKKEIEDLIDNGKDELRESIGDVKVLTTLEIGDIGFTQMAIDESKGKRRILNGQLIIQDQYVEFTKRIKETRDLFPDRFCTESEWQTELTMSANGVCYKYVIDDEAGTIRLPKYPDYFDLSINTGAKSQTVSVYGNGKTLGLNNGSANGALYWGNNSGAYLSTSLYNKNVGTTLSNSAESGSNRGVGVVTNASSSGLTGKVTVPAVQSEKIKGQYFIQVATGAETEDNIINEIELNNPFSLLDYKYSEYELNNLSWLRSNGQYNSKAVYPAVYDLLLKIYNGTETKAGVSVKLSTEASTDYDFVLNTAEETFRLPIKVKLASGKAVVGNGMALGLTNGTNNAGLGISGMALANDINIYGSEVATSGFTTNKGLKDYSIAGVTTDPTKSGIELSDSGLYLYFYVGETVQNANLINAGRIEEKVADIGAELQHKLNDKQITNCLLEVPQNIKLELNNGTLTLKAGSKVIVPNGAGVFDEVNIASDVNYTYTHAPSTNTPCMLFINNKGTGFISSRIVTSCFSGTTQPSGNYINWYNTTENKMYSIGNNATVDASGFSFPIAIITQGSDGVTKSINQVFNGMGYIGSTIWVDKGVKGLVPNGRNESGDLNNIEATNTKVTTITVGSNHTNNGIRFGAYGLALGTLFYKEDTNYNYPNTNYTEFRSFMEIGKYSSDANGKIQFFQAKLPFRAMDASTPHITETYVNGTSGYRIWSDKFCEQWGRAKPAAANNGTIEVTLLKAYKNTNGMCLVTSPDITFMSGGGINYGTSSAKFIANNKIRVKQATGSPEDSNMQWYTTGYLA